jgi:hypothetical protein
MGFWLGSSNRSIAPAGATSTPTYSPAAGTYSTAQSVSIACSNPGAAIYYTVDGSTPTFPITGATTLYTAPISVSGSQTINAIATVAGHLTSPVGSAAYTISSGVTFDFFIAPNGDDNNAGTLSSPWSLTALNSKQSTYRGQNVGIIGDIAGTQTPLQYGQIGGVQTTIYSYLNATIDQPFLNVDGGTSGSPTYIGSCNSSGVYTRGWAIIDCSNPSGGAHPSLDQAILMGQNGNTSTQVPHPDNITYDGLTIRNFCYCGISEESNGADFTNVVVKNCEFYGVTTAVSENNPGCVRFQATNGAQVINCKFHDCQTESGSSFGPYAYPGVFSYSSNALTITNCTFYNIISVQQKDTNQDAVISYCYLDAGSFGSAPNSSYGASYYEGCVGAGHTTTMHHNIILGMSYIDGGSVTAYTGAYSLYNNTYYCSTATQPFFYTPGPGSGGTVSARNNLFISQSGSWSGSEYGVIKLASPTSTLIPQWNYNYYTTAPVFNTSTSYASWQALGFDANSHTGGSPFSGTPTAQVPTSFALNTSSAAYTGGVGGAICGALDGSGSIGTNF